VEKRIVNEGHPSLGIGRGCLRMEGREKGGLESGRWPRGKLKRGCKAFLPSGTISSKKISFGSQRVGQTGSKEKKNPGKMKVCGRGEARLSKGGEGKKGRRKKQGPTFRCVYLERIKIQRIILNSPLL